MLSLRALIRENRRLALALLVLAFCIKAAIPAGFMVSSSGSSAITVTICSDVSNGLRQLQIAIPGKDDGGNHSGAMKKGEHCAFSGLAKVAVGGADLFLLALAFAFILLIGLAPSTRLPLRQLSYLRPPLRGPPALT
jgi:hypothetical protein